MAGSHVHFFGKFFRQIIPLSIIRYTPMSGTPSFIQAPGDHTAGVSGLQPRAAPKCFARAEENALGASLNAQSQAPDILETPYKFHDDPQPRAAPKCFARAEETALGVSLNAQSQAPDEIIWAYCQKTRKKKQKKSLYTARLMYMAVELALTSLHPPRPYATRSHMHTGPLVIAITTPSLWLTRPRD